MLLTAAAGRLHLYLYTCRGQGNELRYDLRTFQSKSKAFLFGSQLWADMFWSLVTNGVAVWTAYEAFFMWVYAHDIASMLGLEENPFLFLVLILLTPYWTGF